MSCAWVAKSSANILFRADSHGPSGSLMTSAIPVSLNVIEALVITDEPRGIRASTASRAASRSSTTSTLKPCSSSATTVACRTRSSGRAVNRSDAAVAVMCSPSSMQSAVWPSGLTLWHIEVSSLRLIAVISRSGFPPTGGSPRPR